MMVLVRLLGVAFVLTGVALGIYVGGYVCLYGGIVETIHGAQATPLNAHEIAIGIIKVACCSIAGVAAFAVCSMLGLPLVYWKTR